MLIVTKKDCELVLGKLDREHYKVLLNSVIAVSNYIDRYSKDYNEFLNVYLHTQGFSKSSLYRYKSEVEKLINVYKTY